MRGGITYNWVGLELALAEFRLGISERRAIWLDQWFTKVLRDKLVLVRDSKRRLGEDGLRLWCVSIRQAFSRTIVFLRRGF